MRNGIERFIEYAKMPTMSCEDSSSCPSTEKQRALALRIAEELRNIGLSVEVTDECYVYAKLEANASAKNKIGLIAHMDTSPDAPDDPISPGIVRYDGEDIALGDGAALSEKDYTCLSRYRGEELIVTDGKTLLGADDKAGVCEIISALERIVEEGLPHGEVSVAFTPDEEIGRGADLFDVKKFGADYAYTVDGGALGEIEYENFNAASAVVEIHGVSIHPGSAKGKMINASEVAAYFHSLVPEKETPYYTEEYEGFYHLTSIEGCVERATLKYIIRDHDRAKFETRKELFRKIAERVNERYGDGTAVCILTDSYYNMKEKIEPVMYIIDRAKAAFEANGVEPAVVPIRGGTDGARLSFVGLPCPNLCTGGENFHSRFEFLPVESFNKIVDILVTLVTDLTEK
ncbi:MAG: peptidase T [Clostridia bacterium]|nr:peptidase T [Clostridia bacterium]